MGQTEIIVRSMSYESQRLHFIDRLKERYGISISECDYDKLCNPYGVFHGCFGKQKRKTIGWVMIQGQKVWVLRDGGANRLATAYPASVEYSDIEMIRSCFGGVGKCVAMEVYKLYLREVAKIYKLSFGSDKEAAIYFFTKTLFAPLHMEKFKRGRVHPIKVAIQINKILTGSSSYATLTIKKTSEYKEKAKIYNQIPIAKTEN